MKASAGANRPASARDVKAALMAAILMQQDECKLATLNQCQILAMAAMVMDEFRRASHQR